MCTAEIALTAAISDLGCDHAYAVHRERRPLVQRVVRIYARVEHGQERRTPMVESAPQTDAAQHPSRFGMTSEVLTS